MSNQELDDLTPFSAITRALSKSPGRIVSVPDTWRQGRAMFGGLAAALCVQVAIEEIADLPPLRSAQFLFVGPATEEGFWLIRRRLDFAKDGYSTETITVWNSDREPMMVARQNVALFA